MGEDIAAAACRSTPMRGTTRRRRADRALRRRPAQLEEANAHRADERLPLADLYKATEVVALARRSARRARHDEDPGEVAEGRAHRRRSPNTPTAKALVAALPAKSRANAWGDEVYFALPVTVQLEPDAREVVDPGAVCFWVQGSSLALPYGPTPVLGAATSAGSSPRSTCSASSKAIPASSRPSATATRSRSRSAEADVAVRLAPRRGARAAVRDLSPSPAAPMARLLPGEEPDWEAPWRATSSTG